MASDIVPLYQEILYQDPIELYTKLENKAWSILFDSANHDVPFQNINRYSYIAFSPLRPLH